MNIEFIQVFAKFGFNAILIGVLLAFLYQIITPIITAHLETLRILVETNKEMANKLDVLVEIDKKLDRVIIDVESMKK